MERPAPRLIRTPTDAEHAACDWMQYWGFVDAFVAGGGGPDGGVDVDSSGAVGQVKAEMRPVSRPVVQQTYGIAAQERKQAFVFGLNGFTKEAIAWSDAAGVGLFGFDLSGEPRPVNATAMALVAAAASGDETTEKADTTDKVDESYPRVFVWDPSSPDTADLRTVFAQHADIFKGSARILFYGPASAGREAVQLLAEVLEARLVESTIADWLALEAKPYRASVIADIEFGAVVHVDQLVDMPDTFVDYFVRAVTTHQCNLALNVGSGPYEIDVSLPTFTTVAVVQDPDRLPDDLRNVFETWIVRPFARADNDPTGFP